jgi:dephospho-CoA kinase
MFMAGLTGNFGMGKSCVLSFFRELGAVTLDADRIVAQLLEEKAVIREMVKLFGKDVISPDGLLDKKAVARKVFSEEVSRREIEALLHPLVFREIDHFTEKIRDKNCLVIIEVPLLFEGEHRGRFRKVITVYTQEETAVERLVKAGYSSEEVIVRLKAQLPIETKKAWADYTIDNSGTKEETKKQVKEIYRLLIAKMH